MFQLKPSITVAEEYTDNFDRTPQNTRDNFRSLVTPGFTLTINGAKTKGEVGGSASYARDSVDNGNEVFFSGTAGVSWDPNPRFSLFLSDTLNKNDVPGLTGTLGTRRGRSTFTTNSASLTANYRIGNVQTQGTYGNVIFDDKDPTGEDTHTHRFGATVGTTILQSNVVNIGYTRSLSDFSRSPDATTDTGTIAFSRLVGPFTMVGVTGSSSFTNTERGGTDAKIYSAALTASHSIPEGFSVSGRVGYSKLELSPGGSDDSFLGGLSVTYKFAKASATLAYDEGFVPTFESGQNSGIVKNRQISGTLTYPMTPFVTATLNGFYAQNEFRGGTATTASATPGRETESLGANVDLGVQLLRWLRLSVGYGYETFNSNASGEDFNENKGRISLTGAF